MSSLSGAEAGPAPMSVRYISAELHQAFIDQQPWASFLQTPAWASMRRQWRRESIGWFRAGDAEPCGVGLVLQRPIPGQQRRTLAYLPEGPAIDWSVPDLEDWLVPMATFLRKKGAFGVRIGPLVVTGRWNAEQIKQGLKDPAVGRLVDLPSVALDVAGARLGDRLTTLGWRSQAVLDGWGPGQPQYNFHVPLVDIGSDGQRERRTEEHLLQEMNQQWRRNIRKAVKEGVVVSTMDATTPPADLAVGLESFHALYVHTAQRDGFPDRELVYFERMFDALRLETPRRIRLFLAHHEGHLVAASIFVMVGVHAWYAYGASSTDRREVRGSNAMQWAMIRHALAAGAEVYDMRGITSTLDPADDNAGLIQFKVGTGGDAVQYAGEWDLPLNRLLYAAFSWYTRSR
jgi:lipid II:glycine glycyltransferase (peptidoglycan interpeptide bridge formation enzyme)